MQTDSKLATNSRFNLTRYDNTYIQRRNGLWEQSISVLFSAQIWFDRFEYYCVHNLYRQYYILKNTIKIPQCRKQQQMSALKLVRGLKIFQNIVQNPQPADFDVSVQPYYYFNPKLFCIMFNFSIKAISIFLTVLMNDCHASDA